MDPVTQSPNLNATPRSSSRSKVPMLVGGVILIVIVAGAWMLRGKLFQSGTTGDIRATAPAGTVFAGVPTGLLLDKDAVIISSNYSVITTPNGSEDHYTLKYSTSLAADSLYAIYLSMLPKQGYALAQTTKTASGGIILAARGAGSLGILIKSESATSTVSLVWSVPSTK